jgi:hypothetical protein
VTGRPPTPEELRAFGGDALFQSRTYLDMTGRQPTPEEQRAFLKDPRPSAEKRKALVEKLGPSSNDAEFLRRVYLDNTGRVPTPGELRSFFDDPRPSAEKRKAVIDKLSVSKSGAQGADAKPADAHPSETKAMLLTKEWKVPPHLIPMKPDGSGPENARDWLTSRGIVFEGAAAASVPRPLHLVVRNTPAQLDLIDQLIISWNETHPTAAEEARPAAPENPVLAKAGRIIIPKIEMREATFAEALELLRKKAVESDPDKRGVTIAVKAGFVPNPDMRITVSLTNIPLIEAMNYITGLANVGFVATPDALMVQPASGGGPGAGGAPPPIPGLAAVPRLPPPGVIAAPQAAQTGDATESPALAKAREIIIPKIEVRDATFAEALELLRKKAVEFDPDKKGVTIAVKPGFVPNPDARISLSLTNIPLIEAVKYVTSLADVGFVATPDALMVRPASGPVPGAGETPPRIPGLDPVSPPPGAGVPTRKLEPTPEEPRSDQGQNTTAEKPVELQADNTRMENGVAIAKGNAHLAFGKYNASADVIHYHPDTRSADFIGHVEVKDGINLVQAEEISVNLETGSIKIQGPHRTSILPPAPPAPGTGK